MMKSHGKESTKPTKCKHGMHLTWTAEAFRGVALDEQFHTTSGAVCLVHAGFINSCSSRLHRSRCAWQALSPKRAASTTMMNASTPAQTRRSLSRSCPSLLCNALCR